MPFSGLFASLFGLFHVLSNLKGWGRRKKHWLQDPVVPEHHGGTRKLTRAHEKARRRMRLASQRRNRLGRH